MDWMYNSDDSRCTSSNNACLVKSVVWSGNFKYNDAGCVANRRYSWLTAPCVRRLYGVFNQNSTRY